MSLSVPFVDNKLFIVENINFGFDSNSFSIKNGCIITNIILRNTCSKAIRVDVFLTRGVDEYGNLKKYTLDGAYDIGVERSVILNIKDINMEPNDGLIFNIQDSTSTSATAFISARVFNEVFNA